MQRISFFWLLFALLLAFFSYSGVLAADFVFKDHGKEVRRIGTEELIRKYSVRKIAIYDINAKKNVTYSALPFNPIMRDIFSDRWNQAQEALFTCGDGYQPSIPRQLFSEYEALLAFAREGDPEFTAVNELQGGKKVHLGPFYLIWDTSKNPGILKRSPDFWPYQIVSVELASFGRLFPNITPPKNATKSAQRGFVHFRELCISCHAINGQGSKVGPELNYPTSVTEMLFPPMLRRWLASPREMRWNTLMPGVPEGTPNRDQVIDDVIAYLKAMKGKKLMPNKEKTAGQRDQ